MSIKPGKTHHGEPAQGSVRSPEVIESAITYVSVGYFDNTPETVHAKAAHLMRLLVAEHPFVDGNKRTALNTVAIFYELNDYEFNYDDEPTRDILKQFATDAEAVDMDEVIAYFRSCATTAEE